MKTTKFWTLPGFQTHIRELVKLKFPTDERSQMLMTILNVLNGVEKPSTEQKESYQPIAYGFNGLECSFVHFFIDFLVFACNCCPSAVYSFYFCTFTLGSLLFKYFDTFLWRYFYLSFSENIIVLYEVIRIFGE